MDKDKNSILSPVHEVLRQQRALRMEIAYERETYKTQTEKAGVERLVQRGDCWWPISLGRSYYNAMNQFVVEVNRENNTEIDYHFEPGKSVRFFTQKAGNTISYVSFPSHITFVHEGLMVVTIPGIEALQTLLKTSFGLQLFFDETSYTAMLGALDRLQEAKGNRLASLRDITYGLLPFHQRPLPALRFSWLNTIQESAVNHVLAAQDVAIVHGPPGTGKTTTLVEAIYETLRRESQVMVCAQSNMAVDWIAEKLVDRGVAVLRIGNPVRVNDKMLAFTYERRFEAHASYPELWNIRRRIRQVQTSMRQQQGHKDGLRNLISKLKERAMELEVAINESLFLEARVIACTLIGADHRILVGKHFSSLFIDEAAQALEVACWVAIAKADRFILAGDHHQLPPTIKNREAAREGLDQTLMDRMVHTCKAMVSLLMIQYRMRPEIMGFPSQWFYHNALRAAPEASERRIAFDEDPLVWIDTTNVEEAKEQQDRSSSRINRTEAQLTIQELKKYIQSIGRKRVSDERLDFGLISPYRAQVRYLRDLIKKESYFKPIHSAFTVQTVDGFQGQERDIIFISIVRSNAEGQIGFLRDYRRMNVAMTRARLKFVFIGDASTLCKDRFYAEFYQYVKKTGRVVNSSYICDTKINKQ